MKAVQQELVNTEDAQQARRQAAPVAPPQEPPAVRHNKLLVGSTPEDAGTSTAAIIMRAVSDPACDPAKLSALLAVRREWNADEAAAAFNAAVVRFQQRCPIVAKDDSANGRPYARMDRIWRTIRPLLVECGLAVTWESVEISADACCLNGTLRHERGHAQALHHEIPLPSAITGQNPAQRAASGETYAKRYATCAALGVQTGDDTSDDDGNGGNTNAVTTEQAANLKRWLEETKSDTIAFLSWGQCKTVDEFPAGKYQEAVAMFRKKGVR